MDYLGLALSCRREEFVAYCPWLFLVGRMRRPARPLPRTLPPLFGDEASVTRPPPDPQSVLAGQETPPPPREPAARSEPLVLLPLRKVQPTFPSMITVGRTANNDVVLEHTLISRFHAFFRGQGARWELIDAGSRNGTFIAGERLAKKGARSVISGDHVAFAQLVFALLDAGCAWERVRAERVEHS